MIINTSQSLFGPVDDSIEITKLSLVLAINGNHNTLAKRFL